MDGECLWGVCVFACVQVLYPFLWIAAGLDPFLACGGPTLMR